MTTPAVIVPGVTPISFGTGVANALQLLGYTVDRSEITTEEIDEEVPGDQGGGEGGIPIEIQKYGQILRGQFEFSKWDPAVLAKLESGVNSNGSLSTIIAGTSVVPGSLVLANSAYFRMLVNPPGQSTLIRNCPLTIIRGAKSWTGGTKWSRLVISYYVLPDLTQSPPLLWNQTTS